MSVQTQIDRISGAVSAALAALSEKGVTVPAGTKVDGLAALIAAIEAGGGTVEGQPVQMIKGTFVMTEEASSYTVEHNLGKTPVFVACYREKTTKMTGNENYFVDAFGTSDTNIGQLRSVYSYGGANNGLRLVSQRRSAIITTTNKESINNATENTITFGNDSTAVIEAGVTHVYVIGA
jgi:hypothetical protein